MTIINEAVRLFFAMTALILVGLLSAPMTGDLNFQPTKGKATQIAESKTADAKQSQAKKKKLSAKKIAAEQKRLKLRKS